MEKETEKIRRELNITTDPDEKERLLRELAEKERSMKNMLNDEKRLQESKLEERRKKKAALMELRKMKLDLKALKQANQQEIDLNTKKFDEQIASMEEAGDKYVDKEVRNLLSHNGPGKEQALVLINETQDELLSKKLKILMSKQFFDLSKYLSSLQAEIGM